jgi:hypothetical protein
MLDSSDNTPLPQPLDYASPQTFRMVAIAQFPEETEAHMAAGKLESEGIGAEIKIRMPFYGLKNPSAVLAVHPDDVARAVELLEQTPAKQRLIQPDGQVEQ